MDWIVVASDADGKDESVSPQSTQEAMLSLPRGQVNPQGGPMIWDPISRSYVPLTDPSQEVKPDRYQVPGTPRTPNLDYQMKTKNPEFSGVFAAAQGNYATQMAFAQMWLNEQRGIITKTPEETITAIEQELGGWDALLREMEQYQNEMRGLSVDSGKWISDFIQNMPKRQPPTTSATGLKCHGCGHVFGAWRPDRCPKCGHRNTSGEDTRARQKEERLREWEESQAGPDFDLRRGAAEGQLWDQGPEIRAEQEAILEKVNREGRAYLTDEEMAKYKALSQAGLRYAPDYWKQGWTAATTDYRAIAAQFQELADAETSESRRNTYEQKVKYYTRLAEHMEAGGALDPAATQADHEHADTTDTYMDRSDKPTKSEHDDSFPSMISRHTNGVTSSMLYNSGKNSYQEPGAPSLRDCPEGGCGGMMQDHDDESHCHDCGHKEKIHYAAGPVPRPEHTQCQCPECTARREQAQPKTAFLQGLLIGMAARGLMGKVMGGGSGGGDAGGGVMGEAEAAPGQSNLPAPNTEADDDMAEAQQRQSKYAGLPIEWIQRIAGDDLGPEGYENHGYDSEPHAGNKGSEMQDNAAPELDSDVNDTGGTQGLHAMEMFDLVKDHLESIADDEDSHKDPIARLMHEVFETVEPGYLDVKIDEDMPKAAKTAGALCPQCKNDITALSMCAVPDPQVPCPVDLPKNGQPQNMQQNPASMGQPLVQPFAASVHEAGRRPKMCPVHDQLVNYALLLGDPAAAIAAFSGSLFGEHSCQGGYEMINKAGNPTKCRYKPEMIKQDYWDAKDAEAEERKLEREQQEAQQQALIDQMNQPPVQEEPQLEEGTIVTPSIDAEPLEAVTQDIPDVAALTYGDEYIPAEQGAEAVEQDWSADYGVAADSAVPEGMLVGAKIKWSRPLGEGPSEGPDALFSDTPPEEVVRDTGHASDGPLDTEGNPLTPGRKYEVSSSHTKDYVPDIYEISASTPQLVSFMVETDGSPFTYTSTLTTKQIASEGIQFRPTDEGNPNARGAVDQPSGSSDATGASDDPTSQTDLDTGGNSKAARSVTAGRDFTIVEQRHFVNESGTARNLDKLDLEGTHYPDGTQGADPYGDSFF